MKSSIIPIFIPHAGCPNLCVFCNQRSIAGDYKIPSPAEIERIVQEALPKTGGMVPELAFYGGSFTAIPLQVQKACLDAATGLFRRGLVSSLRFSTRPDAIDENILDFVGNYPVKTIELGVQSMDDKVLELSGRGCTSQDAIRASGLIKKRGISLILQMMAGLPGEREGSAMETARKIAELEPDGVRIYPVAVIRGTELENMMNRGEYTPLSVEQAADICAELLEFFEERGIKVIRLGLNPSEDLKGEVVAGAYHPALGEMARSRILLKRAIAEIDRLESVGEGVGITVSPSLLSAMIGQKRENVKRLEELYGFARIEIKPGDLPPGKVEISRI